MATAGSAQIRWFATGVGSKRDIGAPSLTQLSFMRPPPGAGLMSPPPRSGVFGNLHQVAVGIADVDRHHRSQRAGALRGRLRGPHPAGLAIRAKTIGGIIAKLEVIRLIVGDGDMDGDEDIVVPGTDPWFAEAIKELGRLSSTVS